MKRITWIVLVWLALVTTVQAVSVLQARGKELSVASVLSEAPLHEASAVSVIGNANELDEKLFEAATKGDTNEIERLVNLGAKVNFQKTEGTVLIAAIRADKIDVVLALIKLGADPNLASKYESPLHIAVNRDTALVKTLLDHGANPNSKLTTGNETPLWSAAGCNDKLYLQFASKGHYNGTRPNCIETVRLLIKGGADLNAPSVRGEPPIINAVFWNNPETVKLLVASGADVNKTDSYGTPPLKVAFYWYALEQLAKQTKKPNSREPTQPMIELLLQLGADPNYENEGSYDDYQDAITTTYTSGCTFLAVAARHGWYDVAQLLLKHGADPMISRSDNALPVDIAKKNGYPKLSTLIKEYMKATPIKN